ncbi:MAG: glutaredoxin family protein [Patescibacteria group bacterium]|nr:glutaredoxin family protein [Patescibacteria group bacterium]
MIIKVKIYTIPTCVYCKMAKDFFAKNEIEYEEYDVSKDKKALAEMVEKSHQMSVPVIDIENEIFVGFNRSDIEKVLRILKQKK